MDIEFVEPVATCRVKVGVFTFVTPTGNHDTANFFVSCETDSDDPVVEARNLETYNTQLTDEWERLVDEGYTQITYVEVVPSPIC